MLESQPAPKIILTPRGFALGHKSGPYPVGAPTTRHLFGAKRPGGGVGAGADLSAYVDQIRDQRQTQRCVGAARARVIHIQAQVQKYGSPQPSLIPYPSEIGIYALAREEESIDAVTPLVDQGSVPALADKALTQDIGVPLERDWPDDDSKINDRVPPDVLARALSMRVTGYYVIDSSGSERVDDCVQALDNNHAFTMCIQVGSSYEECDSDQLVTAIQGKSYGGHCIAVVGYRVANGRRQFLNPGSWGSTTGWGFGGWAWLDEGVLSDSSTTDMVVNTVVPDFAPTSAQKGH